MRRIWTLGDAVVDLIPEDDSRLLKCPGGAPANVAVGISRLGGNSAFIGCVGKDAFGAFMQNTLNKEGVDTKYLFSLDEHKTSTVLVSLDGNGERTFDFMVRPSADLFLTVEQLPTFLPGEGLHLCSIALSAEPSRNAAFEAMRRVKQSRGWVSFDPNIREDLWLDKKLLESTLHQAFRMADIVKFSREELLSLYPAESVESAICTFAQKYQPSLLLVTLGSDGVIASNHGSQMHFPAKHINVVDTTGAGDAFVAGLLMALSRQETPLDPTNLPEAIDLAQKCGALTTTKKGAMTSLPFSSDL